MVVNDDDPNCRGHAWPLCNSRFYLAPLSFNVILQRYLATTISYQVVTTSPSWSCQPSCVFFAATDSPMRWPEPSNADTVTRRAPAMLRSTTCPFTGSIMVGEVPYSFNAVFVSFHVAPALA